MLITGPVFVVYDPMYERVISVHKTEKGVSDKCIFENISDGRNTWRDYPFEWDEYSLEE
jgi:hypothetical protein